jgi:hypothetical protein
MAPGPTGGSTSGALQQLTGALGSGGMTPQRLAAAVRAALGHTDAHGLLSPRAGAHRRQPSPPGTGSRSPPAWSASSSRADGTSWSETADRQRVYEYAVEPAVLQNLPRVRPPFADRSGRTLQLHAVECGPSITGFPGVSAAPLPPWGGVPYSTTPEHDDAAPGLMDHPDPEITGPGPYQAGWPAPADPEPACPDEQSAPPSWQRNQPPDHR